MDETLRAPARLWKQFFLNWDMNWRNGHIHKEEVELRIGHCPFHMLGAMHLLWWSWACRLLAPRSRLSGHRYMTKCIVQQRFNCRPAPPPPHTTTPYSAGGATWVGCPKRPCLQALLFQRGCPGAASRDPFAGESGRSEPAVAGGLPYSPHPSRAA